MCDCQASEAPSTVRITPYTAPLATIPMQFDSATRDAIYQIRGALKNGYELVIGDGYGAALVKGKSFERVPWDAAIWVIDTTPDLATSNKPRSKR